MATLDHRGFDILQMRRRNARQLCLTGLAEGAQATDPRDQLQQAVIVLCNAHMGIPCQQACTLHWPVRVMTHRLRQGHDAHKELLAPGRGLQQARSQVAVEGDLVRAALVLVQGVVILGAPLPQVRPLQAQPVMHQAQRPGARGVVGHACVLVQLRGGTPREGAGALAVLSRQRHVRRQGCEVGQGAGKVDDVGVRPHDAVAQAQDVEHCLQLVQRRRDIPGLPQSNLNRGLQSLMAACA